jgi:anti-sigma B factor antagonist
LAAAGPDGLEFFRWEFERSPRCGDSAVRQDPRRVEWGYSRIPKGGTVNFSATIRQTGEVSIVDLTGQLTSFASGALRDTVGGLVERGRKQIVLNVCGLLYLDSSGVGELVNCYMSVIKQGGEMKVVGLTPKVEEILKITKLHRVFQEFHDEETALQSFPGTQKKENA